MTYRLLGLFLIAIFMQRSYAAEPCANSASVLGTSRVLTIDPLEHRAIGTLNYPETLPLQDHEIVLTFDDGPLAPKTPRVLDALAAECVKATFFLVGQQAALFPDIVRRIQSDGHTIGTHTQHHAHLDHIAAEAAKKEIVEGVQTVTSILGEGKGPAPFFRFPYLDKTGTAERYVWDQGLMIWSVDLHASDWTFITPDKVRERVLSRLEQVHKGVILLHDIQERTARALPDLLHELKNRDYHVVHVIPADRSHPKTVTSADQWAAVNVIRR